MSMRDLVEIALNQTCGWKQRLGANPYGGISYADERTVACRVSYKFRLVLNGNAEEVTSTAMITTLAPVEEGDKLILKDREFEVVSIAIPAEFDGAENRRKVYV